MQANETSNKTINYCIFLYSHTILESASTGATLLSVIATDDDDPATNDNGAIRYTITGW